MLHLSLPFASNVVLAYCPCGTKVRSSPLNSREDLSLTNYISGTDWFFFLILDIGNPAVESVPIGTRICIGLLQAAAVRAAGFGTVALSALAPAVQYVFKYAHLCRRTNRHSHRVLYVMMMYISVCKLQS